MGANIRLRLFASALLLVLTGACTTRAHRDRPAVELQLQNSLALAAGHYVLIFQDLERGDTNKIKDELDWWVDRSIIELQLIEKRFPKGDWGNVPVPIMPPDFKMRGFYRSIARFRRDHPRQHSIPLGAEDLRRINDFVQKYE